MPREKESYRDNLERISEKFPSQELLTVKDVATFCGLDRRTVARLYSFKSCYISKAVLAREMS